MKKQTTDVTRPECHDIRPMDIDFRAKLLPKRHNSAQGDGMGLRGMSLLGGQYHHALKANWLKRGLFRTASNSCSFWAHVEAGS